MNDKVRFDGINGLRTIAAIAIVFMHVAINANYDIQNPVFTQIIPKFWLFTFLFMMISSFCVCCGYYNKIKNNEITISEFYKKRFSRIFPFFALMVILEVVYQHSLSAIYEGILD